MSEKICPIMTRCNNPKEDLTEGHIIPCQEEKCQLWIKQLIPENPSGAPALPQQIVSAHCGLRSIIVEK